MQRKLEETQRTDCRRLANLLEMAFSWDATPEGYEHWEEMANRFREMHDHGTSDGKPWVEPEPEIPEGWRKAEPDEYVRNDVKFWSSEKNLWVSRLHQGLPFDPLRLGRTYIVPIDPPLTDRDACVWPRLLVMVRNGDCEKWIGPYHYVGKDATDPSGIDYLVWTDLGHDWYAFARRATPAEIEAAK